MLFLMVAVFAKSCTGSRFHEIAGVVLVFLFVVHHVLNRRWCLTFFKGKYGLRRILSNIVNSILLVAILLTTITAVPISGTVFAFLDIDNGMLVSQIHVMSGVWLLILVSVHLGLRWKMVLVCVRARFIGTSVGVWCVLRLLVLFFVFCGIYASCRRNIGSKLVMYYTFDFSRGENFWTSFAFDYFAIIILYASITHYAIRLINDKDNDNT
ncbi:MAG: DUF4405 domain-containing protein [Planctomycetaceae bacterium]|jgi:hypothetical protein|nr:DUF4405 domain-containing protein [Planctomycetaceae bacterium]